MKRERTRLERAGSVEDEEMKRERQPLFVCACAVLSTRDCEMGPIVTDGAMRPIHQNIEIYQLGPFAGTNLLPSYFFFFINN